jgi:glutathione S-transferase
LKLFWSSRSPFVRFAMVIAHEKGLADAITRERVVVAAASPNADVMAHNPLNKLPTLVLDEGDVLYDSRVICEYFDATGSGARLLPESGPERWRALRRQALGIGLLDLLVGWLPERRRPAEDQNQELNEALAAKFRATLAVLEREAPSLASAPFDAGQAAIGSALGYADFRYADLDWRGSHPALASWYEGVRQRPSFQATEHADVY